MNKRKLPTIAYTREGYEQLKREFDELTARRPQVLVSLQAAREMGDLSENGAYKAARFELSDLDRRLRRATYLLRVAQVTESQKNGTVDFGSTITLSSGSREFTFTLVNEHEANPKQNLLSIKSPYGQAVLGKKAGDRIIVQAPSGSLEFSILKVS